MNVNMNMITASRIVASLSLATLLAGCVSTDKATDAASGSDGWIMLFDGKDPGANLRGYKRAEKAA